MSVKSWDTILLTFICNITTTHLSCSSPKTCFVAFDSNRSHFSVSDASEEVSGGIFKRLQANCQSINQQMMTRKFAWAKLFTIGYPVLTVTHPCVFIL